MRTALRNFLVLATCVLLALPPGWCCIVAMTTCRPAPRLDCVDCRTGCCPQPAPPKELPARAPVKSCCLDQHLALKKTAEADEYGWSGGAADLPYLTITPALATHVSLPVASRLAPPRNLHVLLCVWLC